MKHKKSPTEDEEGSQGVLQGDCRKRKVKLRETAKKTRNQVWKRAHKAKKGRLRAWGAECHTIEK